MSKFITIEFVAIILTLNIDEIAYIEFDKMNVKSKIVFTSGTEMSLTYGQCEVIMKKIVERDIV